MKVGLAVIVGAEVTLIDSFIYRNRLSEFFSEIKFLCDKSNDGTIEKLEEYQKQGVGKVYRRDLNFNFSEQRNYLNNLMESQYILRLDMDEVMNESLLVWIREFKGDKDKYTVQRRELVEGKLITYTPIVFLYRNTPTIYWRNRIHETVAGCKTNQNLDKRYLIIHDKKDSRCRRQNKWYYDNFEEQRKIVDGGN